MLEIKNITVTAGSKKILDNVSLSINKGEILSLFGPNGSGKSTLIKAVVGLGSCSLDKGEVAFKGKPINRLSIAERVKLGLGIMYQYPPKIRGVKLIQIAQFLCPDSEKIKALAQKLSLEEHLQRDLNFNFSGGEMKRAELFQLILQDADFLLLDEPESGVDMENISIMGKVLNEYLKNPQKSALIITHTGYILDYVNSKKGCVMLEGKLWCEGRPKEIFNSIRKFGYQGCKGCQWQQKI